MLTLNQNIVCKEKFQEKGTFSALNGSDKDALRDNGPDLSASEDVALQSEEPPNRVETREC